MVQFCPCFLAQAKFFIGADMQNEWLYIGLFLVIATLIPVRGSCDFVDCFAEEAQSNQAEHL